MLMKPPKPRGFEYSPYYFREDSLEEEEGGPRIKFRRLSRRPRGKSRPIVAFAILAVVVFVLWQYFHELVRNDPKANASTGFKVEEVIVVE